MKTMLTISLGCLICFAGGLYLGVTKVEEQTAKWDVRYKDTDNKVSAFIKVSDPNTVRTYIKQLNDILDDINFLQKLIEGGQLADEALTNILKEQTVINQKLLELVTREEYEQYTAKSTHQRSSTMNDIDELWEWTFDKEKVDETSSKNIVDKLNLIQTDLETIRALIKEIEDSKIGKKIFN